MHPAQPALPHAGGNAGASSSRQAATLGPQALPPLPLIDLQQQQQQQQQRQIDKPTSAVAVKRIHTDADVETWIKSKAHDHLVLFVSRLCEAAVGKPTRVWEKSAERGQDGHADVIDRIGQLLDTLLTWVQEIEPLKGPQRFGNLAFRMWGQKLEENIDALQDTILPPPLKAYNRELSSYLCGAFGSWTRLDYGSGHELSFIAWLCFLTRLSYFEKSRSHELAGESSSQTVRPNLYEERLALHIFPKYLQVAWRLQDRYGLEPAGSHGVWGLDDYQFLPYAIGAAQLRGQREYTPMDYTSKTHKPDPSPMPPRALLDFIPPVSTTALGGGSSAMRGLGASRAGQALSQSSASPPFANLFTSSIARIHSLKRGPFSEHSPILFDVATTVPNWIKVHSGMMKMWAAECLHKRPVVQHFPFGSIGFVWEGSLHPQHSQEDGPSSVTRMPAATTQSMAPTGAPWARPVSDMPLTGTAPPTAAPWARASSSGKSPQMANVAAMKRPDAAP